MSGDQVWAEQERCLKCLGRQFGPALERFSRGIVPCGHCGQTTERMTSADYRTALATARGNAASRLGQARQRLNQGQRYLE